MNFFVSSRQLWRTMLIGGALLVSACPATARTWTDDLNRTWQGEFVRMEGASAIFLVNGKEFPFPVTHLSAPDKLALFQLRTRPPAAVASPTPAPAGTPAPTGGSKEWTLGGVKLIPGEVVQIDAPLTPAQGKSLGSYSEKKTPLSILKMAVAIPPNFDPTQPQKVLIPSASTTGSGLSIPEMDAHYTKEALADGWMLMSADSPDGKPKNDNIAFREEMLRVVLASLVAAFPQAKTDWKIATAGFSGGAGYASHQAVLLTCDNWKVIGMLLMNGGYSPARWENFMRGSTARAHFVPVFISSGEQDGICTPAISKSGIEETKRGGYQRVRTEWWPGQHEVSQEHVRMALEWFDALAAGRKP